MSKWATNRQVLFDKKAQVSEKQPDKPKETESGAKKEAKAPESHSSETVYNWIKSHPFFNLTGLCKVVGYDQANFRKMMEGSRPLKQELLTKIIDILKDYGYASI